ncbi:hypothetical protein FOZ61_002492 [Perkinsus olseni]|uniref:Uncharacterized protein n=1 Tax=Perkinsus olseni TaxID=32597 RepID=A0A7J6MVL3_PEROL|nr:hypothetical protein FOZ61_002492 [Perkinsus olseni]KAF4675554.1 hypothetical protein FOL46_001081 [Perkinsus olseni]
MPFGTALFESGERMGYLPNLPAATEHEGFNYYDVDGSNLAHGYEIQAALPPRTERISKGNGGWEHREDSSSPGGISWDDKLSVGYPTELFEDSTSEYLSRRYRVSR